MLAQYEAWSCQCGAARYQKNCGLKCEGGVATSKRMKPLQSEAQLVLGLVSEFHV